MLDRFVVDEIHVVKQWDDFRVAYKKLTELKN
jgi:RecQ family ATP-dependent DNA helicase